MKKTWKQWAVFMCEVCDKIHDPKDKEIVKKRLTKKMEILGKIIDAEIKEQKIIGDSVVKKTKK